MILKSTYKKRIAGEYFEHNPRTGRLLKRSSWGALDVQDEFGQGNRMECDVNDAYFDAMIQSYVSTSNFGKPHF